MAHPFYDLVIDNKKFDPRPLGIYEGSITFSEDIVVYSLMISYHPAIKRKFDTIRKNLEKFPYVYISPRNIKEYSVYERSIEEVISESVKDERDTLIKELRLSNNWSGPLLIKICTDVLPIPYSNSKITFKEGNMKAIYKEKSDDVPPQTLSDPNFGSALRKAMEISARFEDANFPYIAIKEKLNSKSELIKFIDSIYDSKIVPAMVDLPTRKHQTIDLDRFMLALWLFNLRNDHLKPKEIEKVISEKEEKGMSFKGYDVSNVGVSKLIDEAKDKLYKFYPI